MALGKERGMQSVFEDRGYNELGLMDHRLRNMPGLFVAEAAVGTLVM